MIANKTFPQRLDDEVASTLSACTRIKMTDSVAKLLTIYLRQGAVWARRETIWEILELLREYKAPEVATWLEQKLRVSPQPRSRGGED